MDRGKKPNKLITAKNSKLYMELKDIIREHALAFLPAKSLFRCQGVCRDWKLQISTPFFAHNQSLSYHGISGLFCQTHDNPPSFFTSDPKSCGVPDPSLKFLPVPVDIRSSSNGLFLCQDRSGDKTYYICNPVTKQWKSIPQQNSDHGSDPAVVLIFEPSLLNFEAEYKLVCAFPSADFDDAIEFEIYSSKEGSWKLSGEICFADRKLISRTGVHVNGIVYWKSRSGDVVSFDLIKDRSQLIQVYAGPSSLLGIMDGKLCTASSSGNTVSLVTLSNVHSNTMQIGSGARTWKDKYTFQLDHAALSVREPKRIVYVGNGVVLGHSGPVMYSYDMKKKETMIFPETPLYDARTVPYTSTLVYL
ncbi:hypothetical protein DCAR_0414771 [Daucus carota subsp. sativus]|uniref:F-box protein At3g26010-like beta-propeller domain-containing protein n=1 Tax=Daucus carota subsp. sativus TaxID=79200 RepID=A0A162A7S7_DAUCS|nr:PREDICTED: putative F-box protein At3g23950 [Daucus carota subsp. sativus]WOG95452.1 hypothetical protein DCAR_0414771 [Daucus carota subsp. sativus]